MFILTSCDENENATFDNTGGQTLIAFAKDSDLIQIPIGNGNSVDLDVVYSVTTKSSSDRTVTFSVVTEDTDAPASMYSISSLTATIPANEYEATIQITGFYDVILDTEPKSISLKIDSVSSGFFDSEARMDIDIQMFCPVADDYFVGMYLLEQTSSYVDGPTLSDGSIVEVTADGISRTFSTKNYPNYCGGDMDFTVSLVCNEIIVPNMDSVCSCGGPTDWFGPATVPASYDVASDAIMYITFTDDEQSNCSSPTQTTYKLIKQ